MKTIVVLEKIIRKPSFHGLCGMKVEREVVVVRSMHLSVACYSYMIDGNKLDSEVSVTCVSDPFKEISMPSFIKKTVSGLVSIGFKIKYQLKG